MSDHAETAPEPVQGSRTPLADEVAASHDAPAAAVGPRDLTAEQLAYRAGQRDMYRRLTTPRMTFWRAVCGVLWGVISVAFGIGAVYNMVEGNIGEIFFGIVLAALTGWYDYRIWTLKARRLWFII